MDSNKTHEAVSLVIAANGLVGEALYNFLLERNEKVVGTCFSRKKDNLLVLDLNNLELVRKTVTDVAPRVIFLASNYPGGVNRVEENPEDAKHFYVESLKVLCEYCVKEKATLVFYSTDYVFSDHDKRVSEDELKKPLNYYGSLKDESEEIIVKSLEKYLILRTTNVYGFDPETKTPNFLMLLYLKSKNNQGVAIDPDSFATPTYVNDLVEATFLLLEKEAYGVYHVVGDEFLSRLDWSKKISSVLNLNIHVDEVKTNSNVKRPLKLRLDNSKVKSETNITFTDLNKALADIKQQISK